MQACLIIFLSSCFIVFYNYAGYAVIAYVINLFHKPKQKTTIVGPFAPSVSFIVAAFNEEDFIEKKIQDSLAQNYAKDKIEFIFVTDGSTDGTVSIVEKYPAVRLLHSAERA